MAHLYFKIQLISLDFTPFVSLLHQFEVYLSAFWFCLPASVFYTKLSGYFALLSNAFFLIADVLSFIKIDYGTLKSSQMEDFMQTNNPSPY